MRNSDEFAAATSGERAGRTRGRGPVTRLRITRRPRCARRRAGARGRLRPRGSPGRRPACADCSSASTSSPPPWPGSSARSSRRSLIGATRPGAQRAARRRGGRRRRRPLHDRLPGPLPLPGLRGAGGRDGPPRACRRGLGRRRPARRLAPRLLPSASARRSSRVVVTWFLLSASRGLYTAWLSRARSQGRFCRPVVVIGTGDEGYELFRLVDIHPELGLRVAGVVGPRHSLARWDGDVEWLGDIADAGRGHRDAGANGVIVAVERPRRRRPQPPHPRAARATASTSSSRAACGASTSAASAPCRWPTSRSSTSSRRRSRAGSSRPSGSMDLVLAAHHRS